MFVRGVDSVALFAEISVISMSRVCGLDVIERTLDAKPELFSALRMRPAALCR